tara:strand:- start:623 stop:1234 length:612 start_codon:yes stop_codon:yes gene_type:complete
MTKKPTSGPSKRKSTKAETPLVDPDTSELAAGRPKKPSAQMSLFRLKKLEQDLSAGKFVPGEELARALQSLRGEPIPDFIFSYLIRVLQGEVHRPAGRKRKDESYINYNDDHIAWHYERFRAWLTKRKKTIGLKGWACIKDQDWWQGPVGERAARMVAEDCREYRNLNWRTVRNIVSTRKRASRDFIEMQNRRRISSRKTPPD